MGWVLIVLMAALVFVALWRFGRFDKAALQFLGAALLIALAGYAWQGRPGLEGKPVPPPVREKLPDTAFAEVRGDMLGEFDVAAHWLTIADSYHRRGDTLNAAGVLGSALREHPNNAAPRAGLGNPLVPHAHATLPPAPAH